jgi:hypothetical protein
MTDEAVAAAAPVLREAAAQLSADLASPAAPGLAVPAIAARTGTAG